MPIIKKDEFIDAKGIEKALQDIRKEVDLLKTSTESLQKQTREVNKEGTGAEAKKRIDLTKKLETATEKLALAQTEEAQELAKLNEEIKEQNKLNRQAGKEMAGLTTEYQRQSKQLTDLRNKTKNQTLELQKGRKSLGLSRKEYRKFRKEVNQNTKAVQKLDKNLKSVDSRLGQSQRFVGQYGKALKGVGTQLLGAAGIVGGVQLLVDGFQAFNETAGQVNDLTRKIGTNFGVFGSEAKELAAQVNAIASTFEEDYNEVLQAANVVSKEFGITGTEATRLIEEGFLKGSNNSGEFLDILKEYPVQLQSIGLNAEESFAVINQQVTKGVYSDKGIDALKEAGLRLQDVNKGYQASLKPLGESLNLQIEQEIAAGNVFKATQLISEGLKDNGVNGAEVNEILAKVFGAAGEDAKSFVLSLDDISLSLDDVAVQSSEAEQASLNLSKSWNGFVAGVSDSDGIFGQVFAKFKNLLAGAINTLTTLIKLVSGGDKAIDKIKNAVERLRKEQDEQNKATEENTKSTNKNTTTRNVNSAAIKKQYEAEKKLNEEIKKRELAAKENAQLQDAPSITSGVQVTGGFDPVQEAVKGAEEINKNLAEVNEARRKEELEKEKLYYDALKQLGLETIDTISGFISEGIQEDSQRKLDAIQQESDREKAILEQRLQDGLITEEQFRAQSEALDKKANRESAKTQKNAALYQIGIDTAAGIVKALASSPPPANFINAALVGAQGAIQAALVAAKPLPAFKDGVIGFSGKGTGTSDSNTVKISNKESIITAEGTSNAPLALKAINEGMLTDSDINKTMTSKSIVNPNIRMEKTLSNIEALMANMGWSFDDNGVKYNQRANGQITKSLTK